MGGSGLIVVVIVAAWALFLVPQWMHRRASAAAHLADRVTPDDGDVDADEASAGPPASRRSFGQRQLVRRHPQGEVRSGLLSRLRLPSLARRRRTDAVRPRSAAAQRRRVLAVLALSTLLTAVVVGVGAVAGLPIPTWLVAVPGAAMVGYLVLLAIVRPGAREQADARPRPMARPGARPAPEAEVADEPGEAPAMPAVRPAGPLEPASPSQDQEAGSEDVPADRTWTPVPLPTPTYVTAPRARRAVRTIDLSNPGSWTAEPTREAEPAAVGAGEGDDLEHYAVEHRRAVGD